MITPIEIQSKTFKSGGLGYDKKDVDAFMKDVLKSYENLYRENMELNDKISVLNEGIQYYKTIEKTLQKALVLAEKTAEDTKATALKTAKSIENKAHTKAQLIVADAKNELEHIHNQTITLLQQYEKYKAQFKNLAAAQIEILESDSFSINVARLDAFIPTKDEANESLTSLKKDNYTEDSDLDKFDQKDSTDLKKNYPNFNSGKKAQPPFKKKMKGYYNNKSKYQNSQYQEALGEASSTIEKSNLEEASELDGFDFINLDDEL